jgi:hypothetical protein
MQWKHLLSLGGRDLDIEGISGSLYHAIRESFPVNEVPEHIVQKYKELEILLNNSSERIQKLLQALDAEGTTPPGRD